MGAAMPVVTELGGGRPHCDARGWPTGRPRAPEQTPGLARRLEPSDRKDPPWSTPPPPPVAVAGLGAVALGAAGAADYIPVWVCAVVRLHFLALARVLAAPALQLLGAEVTLRDPRARPPGARGHSAPRSALRKIGAPRHPPGMTRGGRSRGRRGAVFAALVGTHERVGSGMARAAKETRGSTGRSRSPPDRGWRGPALRCQAAHRRASQAERRVSTIPAPIQLTRPV